ncbi:mannose-1-phosphate guanylyltransferase [Halanaerobium hydrogeniformans]|uniref:mannose-1-phosphate guanylyltransferase n=1 Tax=Halanaerobium hydrogeniformans TaxID=656519 RepID=E4RM26_HALHG|nr:mannose-1-phosphate guanylyltransferase [Halanaerobium hydrogeniformans]ADQ14109.1 Mannose-1-phosphate guanylyltransferase [Halanaerobium hydrogeniformans]
MINALIMAGGEGTRFWPLSRKNKPKQFLKLSDEQCNMLQKTVHRIKSFVGLENIYISTNQLYAPAIKEQLSHLPAENIIIEPLKKGTAPSIALSTAVISKKNPGSTIIVLPSDHLIQDSEAFIEIIKKAVMTASIGKNLVTIGIEPTHPETGYGYIQYGKEIHNIDGKSVFKVEKFREKPDLAKAREYLEAGNYLWNSGIFVWNIKTILASFKKYLPEIYQSMLKIKKALGSENETEIIRTEFEKMPEITVEYGIMEKIENIYVIPGSFGWDDLGSWPALARIKKSDQEGNIVVGKHYGIDTTNSIIYSQDKVITTIGLDNLVIVDTDDAILICDKDRAQDVKKIRDILAAAGLEAYI